MISGRYFAMGYPGTDEIAVVVERTSDPGKQVSGFVLNGAWEGRFSDHDVTVDYTRQTHEAVLLWQGNELKGGDDGFAYVYEQIKEESNGS